MGASCPSLLITTGEFLCGILSPSQAIRGGTFANVLNAPQWMRPAVGWINARTVISSFNVPKALYSLFILYWDYQLTFKRAWTLKINASETLEINTTVDRGPLFVAGWSYCPNKRMVVLDWWPANLRVKGNRTTLITQKSNINAEEPGDGSISYLK